jgi:hypothetical protein
VNKTKIIPFNSLSKTIVFSLYFILFVNFVFAQKTIVKGKVFDIETNEPLPFVSVSFKDSKIGTITDINGNYAIETYYIKDSLEVSCVGYLPISKKIKKDIEQTIDFPLKKMQYQIQEIVIKPSNEENPAHAIFRNIIANKDINNREKLEAYEYEIYNKVEIDIDDVKEKLVNFFLFRPIKFVFNNIDSTEEKPFLPAFLSETVSDFYYRKTPKSSREFVRATKISGLQNESVSKLLGDMYQNVNIYDNQIVVFDKSFVSPISNQGLFHYHYYLVDSAYHGNKWCYKLIYKPKRKQELTFEGYFWVNDTTYAIKEIEAEIAKDANINFITNLKVKQSYEEVEPEVWMLKNDQLKVNARFLMAHNGKYQKFIGRKSTHYDSFIINQPREDTLYKGEPRIVVADTASFLSVQQWNQIRQVELTKNEAAVYEIIDSVKKTSYYKLSTDILRGFYRVGWVEFGPYASTYSYNAIEGDRWRLGMRSSNNFSKNLRINTYVAYGTRDSAFKYGFSARWFPTRTPRQYFKLSIKQDLEQLGAGNQLLANDNLLTSASRRTAGNRLNGIKEYLFLYERTWNERFTNNIQFFHRTNWPLGELIYEKTNEQGNVENVNQIITAEFISNTHLSYKESFLETPFNRVSIGSIYPVVDLQYGYGVKGFFGSQYEYHRTKIMLTHRIRLGIYGTFKYVFTAGRIWGTVPYPILELHSGNENYFLYDFSYNLMNFYEFVSDRYVSGHLEHHFQGLFFNKIPLLRKMMLREVITAKSVYGYLDPATNSTMLLPANIYTLEKTPYVEVSAGVENIFSMLRIDAIWRLTHLQNPEAIPFGIRAKLQIGF